MEQVKAVTNTQPTSVTPTSRLSPDLTAIGATLTQTVARSRMQSDSSLLLLTARPCLQSLDKILMPFASRKSSVPRPTFIMLFSIIRGKNTPTSTTDMPVGATLSLGPTVEHLVKLQGTTFMTASATTVITTVM